MRRKTAGPAVFFIPCLIALCLAAPPLSAEDERYRGEVVGVADGDTITVLTTDFERIKVRLYGIDCPEKGQPYGVEAKDYLNSMVYGKTVDVRVLDVDRYSRYVGLVSLEGADVNDLMVAGGYAWLYTQYCNDQTACAKFKASEDDARRRKKGLWGDSGAIPPWEWRRSKRS